MSLTPHTSASVATGRQPPGGQQATVSADNAAWFEKLVRERIGVQLADKSYLIASRLQPLIRNHNVADVDALIARMRAGDRAATADGVEAMTTNETSFFRDHHPFDALADEIFPELFRAKPEGRIRIWNGACSSGQESYSLAISLQEHFPTKAVPSRIEIVSTDVSPQMVERTRQGAYSRFEANRGLPAGLGQKYFDQIGRSWVAKPALRALITTRELNLLDPWVGLGRFDLVLLRNVLIYFSNDVKRDILRRIRTEVLNPGGYLMLGASESTVGVDPAYQARRVGPSIVYQSGGST